MNGSLHIACLQTSPKSGFAEAIDEAIALANKAVAAGACFLFLPEYCGGLASDGGKLVPPSAPEAKHPFLAAFIEFAREKAVWVMVGSIAITAPDGKIYNRGFVVDDLGNIMSRYDKIHMFDIQLSPDEVIRESAHVSPGSQAVLVETPLGNIGHTICYDLRFPHLYRDLAQAGAQILCVPAAFMKKTGEAHWHVLNRARAIENGAFVIAPCSVGSISGGGEAFGHSLVIDPWGKILAEGDENAGVVHAEIDISLVAQARSRVPSLTHDRQFTDSKTEKKSVA
jgi:predicted amidohydrolase